MFKQGFLVYKAWVTLGKFLRKFIDLAVIICQQCTFPIATLTFPVRKNFENRQKQQRRRSAWVGQADFGKIELNNRNHSGNCQRLSTEEKTEHLRHNQISMHLLHFARSTSLKCS